VQSFKLFYEKTLGLIETIDINGIGEVESKVDSGNGAYNVLHGINIQELPDGKISFDTVKDKSIQLPVIEYIDINIGSGNIEKRPVVEFDILFGDKKLNNEKFSIADRTENEYKILIGKEFIERMGGLIDVRKKNNLD